MFDLMLRCTAKKKENDVHWLSAEDIRDSSIILGGRRHSIQEAVKDLTGESSPYDSKKLGIQTVEYKGQFIDLQKMQVGVRQSICIRREHWPRVEKAGGVEPIHADESFKHKLPTKKDFTPDSDNLKRKGRSREAGQD